jgi:Trm5-related predicted tRNA methylase
VELIPDKAADNSLNYQFLTEEIVNKVGTDTKVVLVDPKADEYRTDRRPLFRSTFAVAGSPKSLRVLKQADVETAPGTVSQPVVSLFC